MTDEEIKNKAKETSGGNYYYEQGFIFGFELGEENGRKEKCIIEQNKDGQIKLCDIAKENAELKEINKLYTIQKGTNVEIMNNRGIEVDELRKKNAELKKEIEKRSMYEKHIEYENERLKEQIEKLKCCENCKHHYWNYGDLDCRLKYSCYDTNYDKWEKTE